MDNNGQQIEIRIPWSEWADLRRELNLQIVSVEMLEAAGTHITVNPPAPDVAPRTKRGEILLRALRGEAVTLLPPPAAKPLAALLAGLLNQARAMPGQPRWSKELSGGLRIGMLLDGATLRLQIARRVRYPSLIEWRTVVQSLPQPPVVTPAPERYDHEAWRCLRAGWEISKE